MCIIIIKGAVTGAIIGKKKVINIKTNVKVISFKKLKNAIAIPFKVFFIKSEVESFSSFGFKILLIFSAIKASIGDNTTNIIYLNTAKYINKKPILIKIFNIQKVNEVQALSSLSISK